MVTTRREPVGQEAVVRLVVRASLLLVLVGACGGTGQSGTTNAAVTLTVGRGSLSPGECTLLRWEAPESSRATLDGQSVAPSGQLDVCPETTRSFELVVDLGTNVERRVVVIVVEGGAVTTGIVAEGDTPAYVAGTWVRTGGPPGGLGYDIRMDPRNPDVMYVTDAWAGAFKSVDGGTTWYPINDGITARTGPSGDAIPVFSLTVDPNAPDTIWVGTQFGGGVFRSDDGGEHWESKSSGIVERSLTIRGFTVEPGNSDVVYLAGEVPSAEWNGTPLSGLGLDMTRGAVYKTVDRGETWSRIWYGDNLARYVWVHPTDHDLVYVSTGIFDREAANSDAAAGDPGGVGILRSHDGGITWEVLDADNGIRPEEYYFSSLFMHPTDPDVLLAAAGNDPYQARLGRVIGAIYLTEDGGDTWGRVLELSNASSVEICTGDPETMYAGSRTGIYRSDDGGHQWSQVAGLLWGTADVLAGFPIDMQCDPRDPMRLFVNNYIGGNFLTDDGGVTWSLASEGYTGALLDQIDVARSDPGVVYVAGRMGVFASRDGGGSWEGTGFGAGRVPEAVVVAVSPFDVERILAVFTDSGPDPKVSRDGGSSWHDITTGLWIAGEPAGSSVTRVVFSPYDSELVLAAAGLHNCRLKLTCGSGAGLGVIRSIDGGATWAGTDLSGTEVLGIAFGDDSVVYAAVFPSSIYESSDGGATWLPIAVGIAAPSAGDELSPAILTIATEGRKLYAGLQRGGVMVSTDGGRSWNPSSAGMDAETTIVDLQVDLAHPGVVYAASPDSGVFLTIDGGATWTRINEGLATRAAVDLALAADGTVLYLATNGGGVWRLGAP